MSLSRATHKTFLKTLNDFENKQRLVKKAVDPNKPTLIKSLERNRTNLEPAFSELTFDYKLNKADLNVESSEFIGVNAEGKPIFAHNDAWYDQLEEEYFDLLESSDAKLEEIEHGSKAFSDSKNREEGNKKLQEKKICCTGTKTCGLPT